MNYTVGKNPDKDGQYIVVFINRQGAKTYKLMNYTTDIEKITKVKDYKDGWYEWRSYEYVIYTTVDAWMPVPEFKR